MASKAERGKRRAQAVFGLTLIIMSLVFGLTILETVLIFGLIYTGRRLFAALRG